MNPDLLEALARFRGAKVAVVGDLVADEYIFGETERISREAPVLIVRHERSEVRPGCAANLAANLCALGARVRPIGLVGNDLAGDKLRAALSSLGADVRAVLRVRGRPTASKVRVLAGGKNTRRQQMLRIDRDGPGAPDGATLGRTLAALDRAALDCDALLVSDYGMGLLSAPVIARLDALGRKGVPVCVDARYTLSRYLRPALAKPNEVELEAAVGHPIGDDPRLLERAGRTLLRKLQAQALLVTRGRSGMALFLPGQPTQLLPVHGAAEAVDVTGAGDTVMAVASLGLACGAAPLLAARLANVAGSLVVQKPGTAVVTQRELSAELRRAKVAPGLPLKGSA